MKKLKFGILSLAILATAIRAEERFTPALVEARVDATAFRKERQFDEPEVQFAPKIVYPWEMHSGITGEVILYVQIGADGNPRRIAVFTSSQKVFERAAVANAMQTTWKSAPAARLADDSWFIRRIVFTRDF